MEEVAAGTLVGPLSSDEVKARVGDLFVVIPRFCILQGGKPRPIDDGSIYGQNSTVSVPWRLTLGGADEVVGISVSWLRAVRDDRTVVFQLPDGTFLSGMLNDEWTLEDARSLCGRMADLRKAYRQLAASPGHHFATVVAAWSEGKGEVVFVHSEGPAFW